MQILIVSDDETTLLYRYDYSDLPGPGAVPIRNHFKRLKPIDAVTATTMGDDTQSAEAEAEAMAKAKAEGTVKQDCQRSRHRELSTVRQPHGHLKRLISCLNAHKSHQIH